MSQGVEQEIASKGYVHPAALVTTEWVAEHLDDTGWTEWGNVVRAPIER
jgi:hypothetical protein